MKKNKSEIKELLEMLRRDILEAHFGTRHRSELLIRLDIIIKSL